MENGYKKGHEGLKPAKPVYVFKVTREVYNGLAEAAKATGTETPALAADGSTSTPTSTLVE